MAASRNYTEVIIDGKVFTLSGFESEEYLQKVSNYLNHKIAECSENESYKKQSSDTKSILLALNIADDYFKAKEQGTSLEIDMESKDKEMYDLKHELISAQIKLEFWRRRGHTTRLRRRSGPEPMRCTRAVICSEPGHMRAILMRKR